MRVSSQTWFAPRRLAAWALMLLLAAGLAAIAIAADALVLATANAAAVERVAVPGDDVQIFNLAGVMSVVAGNEPHVSVRVTRLGRDADRLDVQSGMLDGRNTLRVLYPSDRIVYEDRKGWSGSSTMHVRRDGRFGDFRMRDLLPNERRQVRISKSGSGLRAWADLEVREPRGRKVSVFLGVGTATVENVDGDLTVDVASAEVTTRNTRGPLLVDTGSGAVHVTDADGNLRVDTGSGGVDLTRVRGDKIDVDTGSGGVDGEQLVADEIRVDTGSGGVELRGVKADDLSVDTGSGSVEIDLTSDIDRLVVDTGSGGVTVRAPQSLGAEIAVDTGSGGIDTDFAVSAMRKGRGFFHGRVGDGRGTITIETGSGSVRLLQL